MSQRVVPCEQLADSTEGVGLSPSQLSSICARHLGFESTDDVQDRQATGRSEEHERYENRKLLQLLEEKQKVIESLLTTMASLELQADRLRSLRKVVYSPARLSESGKKEKVQRRKEGAASTPLDEAAVDLPTAAIDLPTPNVVPPSMKNLLSQLERIQRQKVERDFVIKDNVLIIEKLTKGNQELKSEISQLKTTLSDSEKRIKEMECKEEELLAALITCDKQVEENVDVQELHSIIADLKNRLSNKCRMIHVEEDTFDRLMKAKFENVGLRDKVDSYVLKVKDLEDLLSSERCKFDSLETQLNEVSLKNVILTREIESAVNPVTQSFDIVNKYKNEMLARRKLQDELMEHRGNIKVFCRVRPMSKAEIDSGRKAVVHRDIDDEMVVTVEHRDKSFKFFCDVVFDQDSTQEQIFDEASSLVLCCLEGFNASIFAYGQTGSGKTFTMEGCSGKLGLNQRALSELFGEINKRQPEWKFNVSVSVVEIYQENIRDLLSESRSRVLKVKMAAVGGLALPGLTWVEVESIEDINQVSNLARQNRTTSQTAMNERSSRSHSLLCVVVEGVNHVTGTKTLGRLNLIDLAGSETMQSDAEGPHAKETKSINQSLLVLGNVMHAIRNRHTHIPYRDSRLTYLLQTSLGGSGKTLMIVQLAPVDLHSSETVAALTYAQRIRTVETGAAGGKGKIGVRPSKERLF